MPELSARERIVLAIDTSSQYEAEGYMNIAGRIGAKRVKVSTALACATSWRYCADLADLHGRDWIADAKLHDARGTVGDAVRAIGDLDRQPYGITVHAAAGEKALLAAQANSEGVDIFGVAGMPALPPAETEEIYGAPPERNGGGLARLAARAGISGLMISPRELAVVKWAPETRDLLTMVEGVHSPGAAGVEYGVYTVEDVIAGGADLVVVGSQILDAANPQAAFQAVTAEVERGLAARLA